MTISKTVEKSKLPGDSPCDYTWNLASQVAFIFGALPIPTRRGWWVVELVLKRGFKLGRLEMWDVRKTRSEVLEKLSEAGLRDQPTFFMMSPIMTFTAIGEERRPSWRVRVSAIIGTTQRDQEGRNRVVNAVLPWAVVDMKKSFRPVLNSIRTLHWVQDVFAWAGDEGSEKRIERMYGVRGVGRDWSALLDRTELFGDFVYEGDLKKMRKVTVSHLQAPHM